MTVSSLSGVATVVCTRADFWPWVGAAAVLSAGAIWWSYRGVNLGAGRKASAIFLKLCGIGLLLACWLEPQWVSLEPKERAQAVALLLDDSRSMRLPIADGGESRGDSMKKTWFSGEATWRALLERAFRVRVMAFGPDVREVSGAGELGFGGSPTSVISGLRAVVDKIGEAPAGIGVLTDGAGSDLELLKDPASLASLPPVFPVLFGKALKAPDVSLGMVTSSQSAFEDAPVTLGVEVKVSGLPEARVQVRAEELNSGLDEGTPRKPVEASVLVRKDTGRALVQLQLEGVHPGVRFYRVSAECAEIPKGAEATLENNTRLVCVNRATGPHKLLYLSGRPNWEFGPMRRALDGDAEVQLRGLIRVAKREPKFAFKGRGGEASNPLFRGFQNGSEADLQRYDQPVVVRVNVDSADELAGGFPKTAEELFSFKGVILHNVEAAFFSSEQLRLLQRFVSERGGGVLMLGGMESFEGGGWRGTPLEAVLPVWLGKEQTQAEEEYEWRLTREGLLEPWLRRRKVEAEERERQAALPRLEVLNHVQGIKPAATALALASRGGEERPALVIQRYGLGRSAALLAGDLFHWGIGDPARSADLAKLWRQIARWLVVEAPGQVEISAVASVPGKATRVQVRVRDEQARPVENADVEVRLRRLGEPESAGVTLRAEAAPESGLYSLEYPWAVEGGIIATASASGVDGRMIGTGTTGWVQDGSEHEFATLSPNLAAMGELAARTGGRVMEAADLDGLVDLLKRAPSVVSERRVKPLWHNGYVFAAALACLLGEWWVRRRSGAA